MSAHFQCAHKQQDQKGTGGGLLGCELSHGFLEMLPRLDLCRGPVNRREEGNQKVGDLVFTNAIVYMMDRVSRKAAGAGPQLRAMDPGSSKPTVTPARRRHIRCYPKARL